MSTVVVQVGQCGNQIGSKFWKLVEKSDRHGYSRSPLIHPDAGEAKFRSVNVDSESKVVAKLAQEKRDGNTSFRRGNLIIGKRGRGNNWALGYYGSQDQKEDSILEKTLEATRKEIERCDFFMGIIMLHSICGGTGSGLGSRLIETLRDEFQTHHLISCAVGPHQGGESSLQHYNSILSLSHLQRYADAVYLFQNDDVMMRLMKRRNTDTEANEQQKGVSFQQMNVHVANCLGGIFLPTDNLNHSSIGFEPYEMLNSICPMPSTKFISDMNHASGKQQTWEKLTGTILQNRRKRDDKDIKFSTIAGLVVARGDTTRSFPSSWKQIESRLRSGYNTVSWNPFPFDFWMARNSLQQYGSLTVVANSSALVPYLEHTLDRSREKFSVKAFLHWYTKYGCEEEDFMEAFRRLQTVVDDYRDAVK